MVEQTIALALAKKVGFEAVDFYNKWNGLDVYIAQNENDKDLIIGYPSLIIIDASIARFATSAEILEIMGISAQDGNYTESVL